MSKSASSRFGLFATVLAIGGALVVAYWLARETERTPVVAPGSFKADAGLAASPMTEEERVAYLAASIRVLDVSIGPELKPNSEEPVPGLLRVTGKVHNTGGRRIDRVFLYLFPQDDSGRVLGSYVENLGAAQGGLTAGVEREFAFTIPAKKGFDGKFDFELR